VLAFVIIGWQKLKIMNDMKRKIEILKENGFLQKDLQTLKLICEAMDEYAKEYHESEVKRGLFLQNVVNWGIDNDYLETDYTQDELIDLYNDVN
jgi:hypothetical protein